MSKLRKGKLNRTVRTGSPRYCLYELTIAIICANLRIARRRFSNFACTFAMADLNWEKQNFPAEVRCWSAAEMRCCPRCRWTWPLRKRARAFLRSSLFKAWLETVAVIAPAAAQTTNKSFILLETTLPQEKLINKCDELDCTVLAYKAYNILRVPLGATRSYVYIESHRSSSTYRRMVRIQR